MDTINSHPGISPQNSKEENESAGKSWIIVLSIALIFFAWGLIIYYAVGVGGTPFWRYGVVPDVPGQSIYSLKGVEESFGGEESLRKQHIMGQGKETGKPQKEKGL